MKRVYNKKDIVGIVFEQIKKDFNLKSDKDVINIEVAGDWPEYIKIEEDKK